MKYKEIELKQARDICKKSKGVCGKCPLRRTQEREGKEYLLFCAYILLNLFPEDEILDPYVQVNREQILNEEIKHYSEVKD